MVAAIGEQILGPTDVSLSKRVDGYTLTLAANPSNIVRTYNWTPGRRGGAQNAARAAGALQGHRINWKGLRGQGLGGGQLGHPAQIHTHHLLRHSALELPRRLPARALRLCVSVTRLHRILPGAAPQAHKGDALMLRAIEIIAYLAPRLWARTRRRDCSRQGPSCSASDLSTPHTACTAHPLRSRHWTNMRWAPSCGLCGLGNRCKAWENGRHTRRAKGSPENRPALRERSQAVL